MPFYLVFFFLRCCGSGISSHSASECKSIKSIVLIRVIFKDNGKNSLLNWRSGTVTLAQLAKHLSAVLELA